MRDSSVSNIKKKIDCNKFYNFTMQKLIPLIKLYLCAVSAIVVRRRDATILMTKETYYTDNAAKY